VHAICSRTEETWPAILDASNRGRSSNSQNAFDRLEPPNEIDEGWHGKDSRGHTIYMAEEIEKREKGRTRPTHTSGKKGNH